MKMSLKTTADNGNNRISALKRLSKPTANNKNVHGRLSAPTTPTITDARQLLGNRNKPVFDARQLLSRQSSKIQNTSLPIRQNAVEIEEEEDDYEEEEEELPVIGKQKALFITRSNDGRLTSGLSNRPSFLNTRNNQLTEPISFTKTIKNTTRARDEDNNRHSQTLNTQPNLSDQKVVISFVNDQYRKRPKSPTPPPTIRRLHSTSAQTTHASTSSRSPIRTNSTRKYLDDEYEPPTKRTTSRNTTTDMGLPISTTSSPKSSLKRTSTDAFGSTQPKATSSTRSNSDETIILITNLRSTVTEDDIIELFSEVGDINDIKTLSRGCIQIIYANREQAEDSVAKYHNRLLDGQLMYVSLQQPISYSTKSSKTVSSQHSKSVTTKGNVSSSAIKNETSQSSSNKMAIDPAFIRQALFNPSNSTTNAVQFQVKL
ncbi:hypothetical protein I4U23_003216 [Adineta vaga]|nr:hypothetical protein I4U23_003216 [Adineta vaga]